MTRYVKITALLETADHDGYCSGEECEYKQQYIEKVVDVPQKLLEKEEITVDDYNWTSFFEELDLGRGSYYCDISPECLEHELLRHEYRYSIVKIEIIEQ